MKPLQTACLTAAATVMLLAPAPPAGAQADDEGPSQISETYRDWRVTCVAGTDGNGAAVRECEMSQQLTLTETGQRVLALAVQRLPGATPQATFVAPFGLILAAGMQIEVNGTALQQVDFLTCMPDGCLASVVLDEATMAGFRAGEVADIRMTALSGETIAPQMSLLGFTSAWNRLGALTGN